MKLSHRIIVRIHQLRTFCDHQAVHSDLFIALTHQKTMKRLLCFSLLLAGCVTTQSLPVEDRSRTYDLDYDLVFDSAVQMLAERGFAIIDAEKDEGIINTDYRAEGEFLSFLTGSTRLKVSALVSDAPGGTRVLLNFDLQDVDVSGDVSGVYNSRSLTPRAARGYYRDFFEALDAYLEY